MSRVSFGKGSKCLFSAQPSSSKRPSSLASNHSFEVQKSRVKDWLLLTNTKEEIVCSAAGRVFGLLGCIPRARKPLGNGLSLKRNLVEKVARGIGRFWVMRQRLAAYNLSLFRVFSELRSPLASIFSFPKKAVQIGVRVPHVTGAHSGASNPR